MSRKFVAILTILLCSVATQVYALGLGTVSVESALNQPLRLRIEILQLGDTRLQDISVQMASVDDFERFSVDRVGFLSDVRFSVESTARGNEVILTSNQIVREPYLSFILETRWPNGRLLSEHTILLDLPVFDEQQSAGQVRQPISPILQAPDQAQSSVQPFIDQAANATPTTSAPAVSAPLSSDASSAANIQPEQISDPEDDLSSTQIEPALEETVVALDEVLVAVEDAVAEEAIVEEAVVEEDQPPNDETVAEAVVEEQIVEEQIDEEQIAEEAIDGTEAFDTPETVETDANDTLSDIALQLRPNDAVSIQQTMLAIQELNPDAFIENNINRMRSGQVLRVPSLADIEAIDPREAVAEVARQNQQFAEAGVQPLAAPSSATPGQDDAPQGQLSVVTAEDAVDASGGSAQLDTAEIDQLDQRILELEAELALRQEEADRARIEREELESRLQEMESQIDAAQEIIRLQDLQLAQLQQELAQAAEQAQQQAALAEVQPEDELPMPGSTSFGDDVMRILTGNSLFMIFGVVLAVLLVVVLLLRRNRKAVVDGEELDEIAEGRDTTGIQQSSEESGEEEEQPSTNIADMEEFEPADMDDDLDDIIGSGIAAETDSVSPVSDSLARGREFIEAGNYARAISLLTTSLSEQGENEEVRLCLAEACAYDGDRQGFDEQVEVLSYAETPEISEKLTELKKVLDDAARAASTSTVVNFDEAEFESENDNADDSFIAGIDEGQSDVDNIETQSFLDDLGIDLDAFDDDEAFKVEEEDEAKEVAAEEPAVTEENPADSSDLDEFDSDDMGMTFDLAGEAADEGDGAASAEVKGSEDDDATEIESFEFDIEEPAEIEEDANAANDADDLDIESLAFEEGAPAVNVPADPVSIVEIDETDDNALDFDFDSSDLEPAAEPASSESKDELETFDFDLEDDTIDTVVESPDVEADSPPADSEPEIEGVEFEFDEKVADGDTLTESPDDEIDLSEFELDSSVADTENELSTDDEGFLDLDSMDDDPADDKIEFDVDDDDLQVSANADDSLSDDDLEFLSDDEEVKVESVEDIEDDGDFDDDEAATKLELAYAYQKMGDTDGAREILQEVIKEGNEDQVKEAGKLLLNLDAS